ncbi:MAG: hypothetical protein CFE28_03715 [Alphaproteobacteria bacterium PA2]|nr:MAG: hypothetical protein CFE28_03715 [Alphaproteobacteria bacterium PA2]
MIPDIEQKRTRLSPQARAEQILEQAADLIQREGLAAVTMERLARDSGISKGLVYNYFPSRDALLTALLQREQDQLRDRGMAEALKAQTLEALVEGTTRIYLEQTHARGAVILPLLEDPSVARLMEHSRREERDQTIRYFVRAVRREYGLDLVTAITAVDTLMNLTGAMGRQVAAGTVTVEDGTAMCVQLITGGLEKLSGKRPA